MFFLRSKQITVTLLAAALALAISSLAVADTTTTREISLLSPDRALEVQFSLKAGEPRYQIFRHGQNVLRESQLGLVRDDADFSHKLRLTSISATARVQDRYEILTAKRRANFYLANRRVFHLQNNGGQKMDIIFQVSNDGVAFRYLFPETDAKLHRLKEETSSFHFLPDTRAWMQPMSEAKSGWAQTNPSYEEYYQKDIAAGTTSPTGAGWVYPALFRSGSTWLLLSESALSCQYCATRLRSEAPDGEYRVGFPDPRESFDGGAVSPQSALPWLTPWRLVVVGSLKTVTESTLGIDLADPAIAPSVSAFGPGKASWSWPLLGDGQTTFEVQKRFVDYAAQMGWRYCLVDALWDTQIGYERMKELVNYGRTKNVAILVWYNSAGAWNSAPQTPRNLMLTQESRVRESDRLKAMGVAGLKIDFFGGDGQSMIGYYFDILDDAKPYGFLINFHGATLPRGLERTYPNLMTAEAIRGEEFITFAQEAADQQPSHAAMLPFTRNVFDPMDFTPVVLDRINDRVERRTTSAFELALSVVFTSGIQHYSEIPEGMAKAPDYVRDFLKIVPSVWDETKFIDGYPGKFAVLARRSGKTWYLAGINGENAPRNLDLDLSELRVSGPATLITDGDGGNLSFRQQTVQMTSNKRLQLNLKPRGGFVAILASP